MHTQVEYLVENKQLPQETIKTLTMAVMTNLGFFFFFFTCISDIYWPGFLQTAAGVNVSQPASGSQVCLSVGVIRASGLRVSSSDISQECDGYTC